MGWSHHEIQNLATEVALTTVTARAGYARTLPVHHLVLACPVPALWLIRRYVVVTLGYELRLHLCLSPSLFIHTAGLSTD